MMASFAAAMSDDSSDNNLNDSFKGPKVKKVKKRLRFNEKLALKKLASLKNKDGDSDSGSECEVNALDLYGPCFKETLHKQKKLKKSPVEEGTGESTVEEGTGEGAVSGQEG
jgi:hypothetical protein